MFLTCSALLIAARTAPFFVFPRDRRFQGTRLKPQQMDVLEVLIVLESSWPSIFICPPEASSLEIIFFSKKMETSFGGDVTYQNHGKTTPLALFGPCFCVLFAAQNSWSMLRLSSIRHICKSILLGSFQSFPMPGFPASGRILQMLQSSRIKRVICL